MTDTLHEGIRGRSGPPDAVAECAAMPLMTAPELTDFLRNAFPQAHPERFEITEVRDGFLALRYHAGESDLRPGGTVSGPTLMALADTAVYLAILAMIGPVALAVTTSLNINFLRKPPPGEIRVEASLLKLGKRLAVGEATIHGESANEPVAHATVTYSIPPVRERTARYELPDRSVGDPLGEDPTRNLSPEDLRDLAYGDR